MTNLNKKAFGGLLFVLVVMAGLLCLSAWTFDYWQAWVFLAVYGVTALLITLYLMKNDRKLLARRVQAGPIAEKKPAQKVIQSITAACFLALLVVSAFDHRFGWSAVPTAVCFVGDVLTATGVLLILFVLKENTFASGTIEIAPDQKVISTGMYGLVRHPMYMCALLYLIGMPLALGSWWGLFPLLPMMSALIWRLLDEEKFLAKNLEGYTEYQETVKYHLIPYVW